MITLACTVLDNRIKVTKLDYNQVGKCIRRVESGIRRIDIRLQCSWYVPSLKFLHLISRVRARTEKVFKGFDKVFGDIISEHRKRTEAAAEEDLADVLLRVQRDGLLECPLTDDNIKAVILVRCSSILLRLKLVKSFRYISSKKSYMDHCILFICWYFTCYWVHYTLFILVNLIIFCSTNV